MLGWALQRIIDNPPSGVTTFDADQPFQPFERHDGSIRGEGAMGQGALFRINLPSLTPQGPACSEGKAGSNGLHAILSATV